MLENKAKKIMKFPSKEKGIMNFHVKIASVKFVKHLF